MARDLFFVGKKFKLKRLAAFSKMQCGLVNSGKILEKIPESDFSLKMCELVSENSFHEISFPDIFFRVEGEKIPAHRAILVARSPYFARLFLGDFRESSSAEVDIPAEHVTAKIFRDVLRFLYTGDWESIISPENCVEILGAADSFLMEDLKQRVEFYIENSMEVENVVELLEISDRFSAHRLRRASLEFICGSRDQWYAVRESRGFAELLGEGKRNSMEKLLKEIEGMATKMELCGAGEIMKLLEKKQSLMTVL